MAHHASDNILGKGLPTNRDRERAMEEDSERKSEREREQESERERERRHVDLTTS